MDAALAGIVARVFPALVTLFLNSTNFNRSLMMRGVEAYPALCPTFEDQKKHKNEDGDPDPFPCLRPGAIALTVSQSAIAMVTSLGISVAISSNFLLRVFLGAWAVILMIATLVYFVSYKDEPFKVEEALRKTSHKWWAEHIGLGAGLIAFFCSLALSVASVAIP
jgi:hypothetical protein